MQPTLVRLKRLITFLQTRHRIMIDGDEYNTNYRSGRLEFAHDQLLSTELGEEHLLMCMDRVPGFSFTTKTWGYFHVNNIKDVEYNSTAFHNLALAQEKKDLIEALVRSGQGSAMNYDDMIKGKGKGIIFLLHGPPGVGKTFTTG
jgi:flagellar biosynthesis GTPase FlhF